MGFFGPAMAAELGKGFIAVRKAGKLPPPTCTESYSLEYGEASIEIEREAIAPGERILIVDDLIATGGSASAARDLVIQCGGAAVRGGEHIEIAGGAVHGDRYIILMEDVLGLRHKHTAHLVAVNRHGARC